MKRTHSPPGIGGPAERLLEDFDFPDRVAASGTERSVLDRRLRERGLRTAELQAWASPHQATVPFLSGDIKGSDASFDFDGRIRRHGEVVGSWRVYVQSNEKNLPMAFCVRPALAFGCRRLSLLWTYLGRRYARALHRQQAAAVACRQHRPNGGLILVPGEREPVAVVRVHGEVTWTNYYPDSAPRSPTERLAWVSAHLTGSEAAYEFVCASIYAENNRVLRERVRALLDVAVPRFLPLVERGNDYSWSFVDLPSGRELWLFFPESGWTRLNQPVETLPTLDCTGSYPTLTEIPCTPFEPEP